MKSRSRFCSIGMLSVPVLFGWLIGSAAMAQSLDEQYEFYLRTGPRIGGEKCDNLQFERDFGGVILPGQAGPSLFDFCSGPPLLGQGPGSSTPSASGGGAAAAAGRGGIDNSALRRRRERARAEQQQQATRSSPVLYGSAGADADASFGRGGAFMSLDYRNEEQDDTFYEGGGDADRYLATAGVDYRFLNSVLAGVALKAGAVAGTFNSGGDFDSRNYGAALYGSWSPIDGLFVDANAGIDFKNLETLRIVGRTIAFVPLGSDVTLYRLSPPYAPTAGATEIEAVNAELIIGYDFSVGRYTIGPRVGATMLNTTVDAYIESGPTPMSLAFDEQEEESLQAGAGLQASAAFTVGGAVLVPQFNANWVHEYRNDQRVITARFAEDLRANPIKFGFLNQPPDRDVYTVRLGAVAVIAGGRSVFVSFEKLLGHDYRDLFGASIGMRWEL